MQNTVIMFAAGLVGLFMSGCSGQGTAVLRLMDAPPDGVTSVVLSVASMDVHVDTGDVTDSVDATDESIDTDGEWQSLAVGQPIDLVQHQGEGAAALLGELPLPEGKVTQIRLQLDPDQPQQATIANADGSTETCDLDLTRINALGVKINHPFKAFAVDAGSQADILVDMDLSKALKPLAGCYQLQPVLKLDKVTIDGEQVEF